MAVSSAPLAVPPATPPPAMPLLDLQDVHVHFEVRTGLLRFRRVEAVRGVSLQLRRGETVAIVGESGSGKTTLGRVTIGQARPTTGRVLFDGQDLAQLKGKARKQFQRRAQAIFQDPFSSLDPYMTLYESLSEPLEIHNIDTPKTRPERIYQALQDVRLTPVREMAAAYPHMISGGQRQRLGIARALIMQPEFLFADEPVSMVDASSRAEILYLLRELQEQHGVAILYITHDIATAVHSAQRIVVMYLGRVVEVGPARRVVENPLHPYAQALIAAVPEPNPANRLAHRPTLEGEPPNPIDVPSGCAFHPRCPAVLAGICREQDVPLQEMEPEHWVACHLYP